MTEARSFTVTRCAEVARADELLALTHAAFRDLPIDPPSSVLNETAADFATRLRAETCFIVEHQRGFLEYGEEAMKPLVLHDIAEAVAMHESTISRVTTRKYMHTPRGIFELKYFFSSHVGTSTGGEVSSTAIRALIKKLTAEENPRKPLSDSKITAILKTQKINVARRTVAKYRELLSIPPSNERKRLV